MQLAGRSLLWIRLLCIAFSAGGLYLALRAANVPALEDALTTMHPVWFFAAVALYGLLFVPAAARWHLVLRLTGNAVEPGATARAYLAGHFFYVCLFGAIGGDTARSALYARRHRLRGADILATAPLDRLLGSAGLLVFAALACLLATVAGGFHKMRDVSWKWPVSGLLLLLAILPGALLLAWRSGPASFVGRFIRALGRGGKLLADCPRAALLGVLWGLLVQIALSGVLALNLQAVSHSPLPWAQMAWTFPVVALMGAVPVTVAGLGAREGAALMLLGMYGISGASAVAASLLSASASLVWALVGAIILWRESLRAAEGEGQGEAGPTTPD